MIEGISLLVPCYNAENYIKQFLQRVNKLNGHFDEILFFDDGSTDRTNDILKELDCIFFTGEINKGPGYARNELAKKSNFKYIHFHDVDDDFDVDFVIDVKKSNF